MIDNTNVYITQTKNYFARGETLAMKEVAKIDQRLHIPRVD